ASDIRRAPYAHADRLVVAGGGGGGGYINIGGHGGGLTGQDGVFYPSWPNSGGKGGSQIAGGAAGVACCSCPTYTTAGGLGQGGNGAGDGAGGGGGGGGYYGGGGSCFAGGGGGSSYTAPAATSVIHGQGSNAAAGNVIISYTLTAIAPSSISGITSFCAGTTTTYSISPVAGATSYTWTLPAGGTINSGQTTTSINVTHGSTSGNVSVVANHPCGTSAPSNLAVTISPSPTVVLTPTNNLICLGDNTNIAASGASTYSWMPGNLSGSLVNVNPATLTTYTVTGTDANGCIDTATTTIDVFALPIVSLGADTTQCGGTILLDAGNAGSVFSWNDFTSNQTLTVSASGIYTVVVTNLNGCQNIDSINVTIHPLPTVNAAAASNLVCLADGLTPLTGNPVGGTWSGPGVSGSSFNALLAGNGIHALTYSYTDSSGCSDTAMVNIQVDLCLGTMNQASPNGFAFFPNPNNGNFTIFVVAKTNNLQIDMYDLSGRLVYSSFTEQVQAGFSKQVQAENLPAGIYTLRITSATEQRTEKITIEK
ncbi:MAG: T9SS type A sorting domain-containing protein, partial [Bacteroidia bacterium]